MPDKDNTLKEVYFFIVMAFHILALRMFISEYSKYNLAFSVAFTLPVVYVIKTYQKELYAHKGKYFILKRELEKRIISELSLLIMSLATAYALYIAFGGESFLWFITGFTGAWILRQLTHAIVSRLEKSGIPVESPPLILIVGSSLGVASGTLFGLILSILFS